MEVILGGEEALRWMYNHQGNWGHSHCLGMRLMAPHVYCQRPSHAFFYVLSVSQFEWVCRCVCVRARTCVRNAYTHRLADLSLRTKVEENVEHFIQTTSHPSNFCVVLISYKSIIIQYNRRKVISEKSEYLLTPMQVTISPPQESSTAFMTLAKPDFLSSSPSFPPGLGHHKLGGSFCSLWSFWGP